MTSIDYFAFNSCSSLKDVFYIGTRAQWEAISIAEGNDYLLSATFHTVSIREGWELENGKWVYYENGAKVKNAWRKDAAGLCYLNADGILVTNCWVRDGAAWRYVDRDGHSVTNTWQRDSSGWCYLDSEGYAVTGTKVIDGKEYHFNSNGVCTNR